jgi:hypothetical protein
MSVNTISSSLVYKGKSKVFEGRICTDCGCTLKINKKGCHDCHLLKRQAKRPLADLKKENTVRRNKAIKAGEKVYKSTYQCVECIPLLLDVPTAKKWAVRKQFENGKDVKERAGWYRFTSNGYCCDCNVIDYRAKQFYFPHYKNPELDKNGEKVIWTDLPILSGEELIIAAAFSPNARKISEYLAVYFEKETDKARKLGKIKGKRK